MTVVITNPETSEPVAATTPLLQVEQLDVQYDGRTALSNVNLIVPERGVTALVGPSGCGKTTFLFALNRLADFVVGCCVTGKIEFAGERLGPSTDVHRLRREIGMVFQRPNPFPISIEKNLHLPLREHGCPRAELAERTEVLLRQVGLWDEVRDRLRAPANQLSGEPAVRRPAATTVPGARSDVGAADAVDGRAVQRTGPAGDGAHRTADR